jgi:hypothetical protein
MGRHAEQGLQVGNGVPLLMGIEVAAAVYR